MIYVGMARRCAVGALLCLSLSGCFQVGDSQSDEKKEPHFLRGKSLLAQMDYQGAIDAFEQALEVNPRSASAHFELGWLYEDKAADPSAAIYHYNRFLKFGSGADKSEADLAKQHINICKLELVKSVSAVGPLPSPVQRELERVLVENKDLQTRILALQSQLDQATAVRSQTPVPVPVPTPTRTPVQAPRVENPHPIATQSNAIPTRATSTARTHVIKSGDTPAAIARRYGISVNALMAANPQVKPTHLQVGQTLNIPAP